MPPKKTFTLIKRNDNKKLVVHNETFLDLKEKLERAYQDESYECMICYEKIKRNAKIWSCECCFAGFHLNCISNWSKQSADEWRCPGCQNTYNTLPKRYTCFCGKQNEPKVSGKTPFHSCASLCFKLFSCQHNCLLTCHAGPCPPCNMESETYCICEKTKLKVACSLVNQKVEGENISPSCAEECGKWLNCKVHRCPTLCHTGDCDPCEKMVDLKCFCSQKSKTIQCGSLDGFSCDTLCNEMYSCNIHQCAEVCHNHNVDQICIFDPSLQKTCFCGKQMIERASCAEDIQSCGEKCEKLLNCGHPCSAFCHVGECPNCLLETDIPCRCGRNSQKVPCQSLKIPQTLLDPFICQTPCRYNFRCKGKHTCGEICCNKQNHQCRSTCGKLLSCRKHNCMMLCSHQGRCHECVEGVSFNELECACGRTKLYPPIKCNTPPPNCRFECSRLRPCGHPNLTFHYCHHQEVDCPPCMIFVEKGCGCGRKMVSNIPCSRIMKPSCGKICEKPRSSCKHHCTRSCHDDSCENFPCVSLCSFIRSCGHKCLYRCHSNDTCSELEPCKESIKIQCPCGFRTENYLCGASSTQSGEAKEDLSCDAFCLKHKKAIDMAAALSINPSKDHILTNFLGWNESLVKTAVTMMNIVLMAEKHLGTLVSSPATLYFYFPKQRLHRENLLILGMVNIYGYFGELVDQNIGKGTVIARRVAGQTPIIPTKLLSIVAKSYSPINPYDDPMVIRDEADADLSSSNAGIAVDKVNGLLFQGISIEISSANFLAYIYATLPAFSRNSWMFWITDSSCFVFKDVIETEIVKEAAISAADNQEYLRERGYEEFEKVEPVFVTPMGGCVSLNGTLEKRAKERNVSYLRDPVTPEDGDWRTKTTWRHYLISVDDS